MSPSRRSPGSPAREVDALQTRLATLRDVAELGEHCLDEEVLPVAGLDEALGLLRRSWRLLADTSAAQLRQGPACPEA